ncbi:hypothetical protein [Legionella waltersii]|nr:hypothetical protein [Legionella waltersii]
MMEAILMTLEQAQKINQSMMQCTVAFIVHPIEFPSHKIPSH